MICSDRIGHSLALSLIVGVQEHGCEVHSHPSHSVYPGGALAMDLPAAQCSPT